MDENLQKYLDHRFNSIDHRLDEIEAKLDHVSDRATSCEKDIAFVAQRVADLEADDKAALNKCKAAQVDCRASMDKSIDARIREAVLSAKVVAYSALVGLLGAGLWYVITVIILPSILPK